MLIAGNDGVRRALQRAFDHAVVSGVGLHRVHAGLGLNRLRCPFDDPLEAGYLGIGEAKLLPA